MNAFDFVSTFLSDIKVAALAPTSRYAIRRMLPHIPITTRTIAEYGPGDGVITKHLLNLLPRSGKLLAIERNLNFVEELKQIHDHRLYVKEGDVCLIGDYLKEYGMQKIDAVISGIPFLFCTPEQRMHIVDQTYSALAPNGVFIVYQFSRLMLPYLREYFSQVQWYYEPRNMPPMFFIMVAKKAA